MISIIVAMGQNRVIGKDNKMPWRLPADIAYFKQTTMGHPVVMGRKTYESIGKSLSGRNNIILTHDRNFKAGGCRVFHEVEEVLAFAKANQSKEVFIIGGDSVYAEFFPRAGRLYVTLIEQCFDGDTFFPAIDEQQWRLASKIKGETDEKNVYEYCFLIYERVK